MLQIVIADECHVHILTKRVVSTWKKFVLRRRAERQRLLELTDAAVKFYNKTLWYVALLSVSHFL